jgi:uncharacterized protein YbcI
MAGFEFRQRAGGGRPTVRSLVFRNTETLSVGDMLAWRQGRVELGATGDTTLLGACQETLEGVGGTTTVTVMVDADAVYGVADANARARGDTLDLTGLTGAQGVAPDGNAEFQVVLDCSADEETLVRINLGRHHELAALPAETSMTGGELNAAVARAVVRYHREHVGRGPTRAHAFYRGNVLVVLLEDLLTTAERTLVNSGREDAVLRARQAFHEVMRQGLAGTIEELTGCKVEAVISGSHFNPDMASEVFVLDRPVAGQP